MGSIYLPATLDTPKREIARYEGGYIKDLHGYCIGRYDNKFVYEGGTCLPPYIGRIIFNYGYVGSSDDITVISNIKGYLTVKGSRYFVYFDDSDEIGAIAAFIVCYKKGMFSLPSDTVKGHKTSASTSKFHTTHGGSSCVDSNSDDAGSCLTMLGYISLITLFIIAFFYASGAIWVDMFKSLFSGEELASYWVVLVPIEGIIIGNIFRRREANNIVESYLFSFAISILIASILCAIITASFLNFFAAILGLAIISTVPFIITVLISHFTTKK